MRLPAVIPRAAAFAGRVVSRMAQTGLVRTAGSLAFTTVLGLVPLATVAFTFAARFPVFQRWLDALEAFLLKHMLPDSADVVVHTYIRAFIERATALTGVSIAFTIVTAVLVIDTVEREINAIWGIRRKRPLARRLVVFAFGATVGPILVGASLSQEWNGSPLRDRIPPNRSRSLLERLRFEVIESEWLVSATGNRSFAWYIRTPKSSLLNPPPS